jgi:hypothetical protein
MRGTARLGWSSMPGGQGRQPKRTRTSARQGGSLPAARSQQAQIAERPGGHWQAYCLGAERGADSHLQLICRLVIVSYMQSQSYFVRTLVRQQVDNKSTTIYKHAARWQAAHRP